MVAFLYLVEAGVCVLSEVTTSKQPECVCDSEKCMIGYFSGCSSRILKFLCVHVY